MRDLQSDAESSAEYISYNTSSSIQSLKSTLESSLPGYDWMHLTDCQMTSICNDRYVPPVLSDFKSDGDDSVFSRALDFATWQLGYVYLYNDAEYAKLSMGPLLADMLETSLIPSMSASSKDDILSGGNPIFSIYSGHDTTLMPVLASMGVWDGKWSPYASMLNVETYFIGFSNPSYPTSRAFRMVYNGEVITSRLPGCENADEPELCDLSYLIDAISKFAKYDRDCARRSSPTPDVTPPRNSSTYVLPTTSWIIILFVCCGAASAGTAMAVTRKESNKDRGFRVLT